MNKNRSIRVAAFCLGLMLAGSLQVHAQKVTFRDGTVSLKQAFEKIEASSKYKIAYNDSHLNVSRKVSLNQKETEVLEILATILKDTGYTYKKKRQLHRYCAGGAKACFKSKESERSCKRCQWRGDYRSKCISKRYDNRSNYQSQWRF